MTDTQDYTRRPVVRLVPTAELSPAPWNPRLIRDTRFLSLQRSIVADPGLLWRRPVLASLAGTIYGGNMRYRAVAALWEKGAPPGPEGQDPANWATIAAAAGIDPYAVPAVLDDIPETIAKERALRDNNQAGEWQEEDLGQLLYSLREAGGEVDTYGFDERDLGKLFDMVSGDEHFGKEEDESKDLVLPDEPISRVGDRWLLGKHQLLVGDATDPLVWQRLLEGRLADCLWTDPPYGVSYVGKTADALTIANDGADGVTGLLRATFANAARHLTPGTPFYICRPAGAIGRDFLNAIFDSGWRIHEELQWVKDSMVLGHSDYHLQHETIVYGWLPGQGRSGRGNQDASRWYGDHSQVSVFEIPRPKRSTSHPTMKPPELVAAHLKNSTRKGNLVVDPFGGSGSTLIACAQTGRTCAMIELDPRYADVIIERYRLLTGEEGVCVRDDRVESPDGTEGTGSGAGSLVAA